MATQIKTKHELFNFSRLRERIAAAIKWWSEHQAWPATEDTRID